LIKLPNVDGMAPESPVAAAPKVVRLVSRPNCEGICPVRYGLPLSETAAEMSKSPTVMGLNR